MTKTGSNIQTKRIKLILVGVFFLVAILLTAYGLANRFLTDERQAIALIKSQNPIFKEYPDHRVNTGSGHSILVETDALKGWYVAFAEAGSGGRWISASCYYVDRSGGVKFINSLNNLMELEFSMQTCQSINFDQ